MAYQPQAEIFWRAIDCSMIATSPVPKSNQDDKPYLIEGYSKYSTCVKHGIYDVSCGIIKMWLSAIDENMVCICLP